VSAAATRSFVYFVRCGRYVKIGFSFDPNKRVRAIQSEVRSGRARFVPEDIEHFRPMELIHVIPGCRMRDERTVHGLFDRFRVAGEWFRYDLAFQRQLAAMRYVTCHERAAEIRRVCRELRETRELRAA